MNALFSEWLKSDVVQAMLSSIESKFFLDKVVDSVEKAFAYWNDKKDCRSVVLNAEFLDFLINLQSGIAVVIFTFISEPRSN